ncbi:unnamed protein product [Eruca vesicaria subsp. sativa]|uniref:Uncharacterized protein n=1 Tax=Eruca vesicaria subsp. sativa TaxID=29727 RepID=A0ABC8K374_ERUVS|nr:unnamed protein product [Eruca vesicaria subsp. sativa]
MLITSTRSLSVSFQGESFSLPERRKPTTPFRDQRENSNPADQHQLWPGASRRGNVDCDSDDRGNKLVSMLIDDSSRDPGSSLCCSTPSSRIGSISSKLSHSKRFSGDNPLVSSPRVMASPIRGCGVATTRPASPSKVWATTQARAFSSPC